MAGRSEGGKKSADTRNQECSSGSGKGGGHASGCDQPIKAGARDEQSEENGHRMQAGKKDGRHSHDEHE